MEQVLVACRGNLYRSSWRMYAGRIELTATHLVYYKPLALGGHRRVLEIELRSLLGFQRVIDGVVRNICELQLDDGTTLRIALEKYHEVTTCLRALLELRALAA